MKLFPTILLVLTAVAIAAPDYHERQIYYSEQDNVCAFSSGKDELELLITIDGVLAKQLVVNTYTFCRPWAIRNADRITPLSKWSYLSGDTDIKFDQEATYHKIGLIL